MKYAIIQIMKPGIGLVTKDIFELLQKFDSLDEAQKYKESRVHPHWYIIIQVW